MKKFLVLLLGLLVFTGCATKEEKAEQKDIDKLESIGFSNTDAQNFYNFSNSVKTIFKEMTRINDELEENSYTIPDKDYKKIVAATEVSKKAYKKLNPKKADKYSEFIDENNMSSPLLILEKAEKYNRKFTVIEAALMMNGINSFALESSYIPEFNKDQVTQWYHNNNDYDGLFKEVYIYNEKSSTK